MMDDWPAPGEIVSVLKEIESGLIVGPSAKFWPPTRAVCAVKVKGQWREVPPDVTDRWLT